MSVRGMICGLGQVGYRVAMLALQAGHNITLVTLQVRPEWERQLREAGATIHFGDARDEDFMLACGLREANWLISATANDLTNIEVALDAKRLHPNIRTVARAFDRYLAPRLESNFGIDRVLAMSQLAAPAFVSAAFGDELVASFEWGTDRYGVVRLTVTEGHRFEGMSLAELEEKTRLSPLLHTGGDNAPVICPDRLIRLEPGDSLKLIGLESSILALGSLPIHAEEAPTKSNARRSDHLSIKRIWKNAPRDLRLLLSGLMALIMLSTIIFKYGMNLTIIDAFYFVVSTVTTTGYGDITPKDASVVLKLFTCLVMLLGSAAVATLYSIITDALISARLQQLTIGHPIPEESHVIVVGLGNVGFRTCEELMRLGIDPVGIDLDPDAKFAATLRTQMAVITGDAREEEVLEQANFANAAAIISATSDDVVNLSVGLLAREDAGNQRIVLRVFDDRFASKVQSTLAFNGALSASRVAAPTFLGSAAYPSSLASFVIRGMLVSVFPRTSAELPSAMSKGERVVLDRGTKGSLTITATALRTPPQETSS